MSEALLALDAVSKRFERRLDLPARLAQRLGARVRDEIVHAVDQVSLEVSAAEVVGLVGESGCGKSTLGRIAAGLLLPSAGSRRWRGEDALRLPPAAQRRVKLEVQMIFQDPFASLNPRLRVEDIVGEAPVVHGLIARRDRVDYVAQLLSRVGLSAEAARRYPHQFSGGQRARIGIARALAVKPAFLVCDEPVAALDVSIQAQVLNLFMQLRAELGLTYLFISHDLAVVRHLSDRVLVMYLGRVVESGPVEAIYGAPRHPYTQALLEGVPRLQAKRRDYAPIRGEIPSPLDPPGGCHFHPRCPHAMARCRGERPAFTQVAPQHFAACHRIES